MESGLFNSPHMAAGYANWRPAVHPYVIGRIANRLEISGRLDRALDIGCGAGLSTAPLDRIARCSIGLEPSPEMVAHAARAAGRASFVCAAAEFLPLRSQSIDLITAAGSLNWADLGKFFPEAKRVLAPGGCLVVYDFGQGRHFRDSPRLAEWFDEFERRHPAPACREIGVETLRAEGSGFRLTAHEEYEVALPLTPEFYLEYVLTETNVAAALRRGESGQEIRAWCETSLAPVFQGAAREVLFQGFIAYLR